MHTEPTEGVPCLILDANRNHEPIELVLDTSHILMTMLDLFKGDALQHWHSVRCIGRVEAVNPWELEVDPDFERTEDEIKRDQEAEQRALRAAAIAMRRCGTPQLAVDIMHGLSSGSWVCVSMLHLHAGQFSF